MNKTKPIKSVKYRTSFAAIGAAVALCAPCALNAEDVDLFFGAAATAENPNVLIVIDNSANWNSSSQLWTDPNGLINPFKQGQSELRALRTVLGEVTENINMGLMLFTVGSGTNVPGGYVRFHMRPMTSANSAAFREMIGPDSGCVDGPNSLNGTPNCMFKNFNSGVEQVGTSFTDYSATLFEVFKYFGGYTSPANAHDDIAGTPVDTVPGPSATHFGAVRYAGNPDTKSDPAAYTTAAKGFYQNPLTDTSCAKNYVIFIGNGFPSRDLAQTVLSNVGGNTTQLAMPVLSTQTVTEVIGESCGTSGNETQRLADCTANIPLALKEEFPHHMNYRCVAGTGTADAAVCGENANSLKYQVQADRPNVVTQTGTSAVPATNVARFSDEWAKFLHTTDVSAAPGQQNVRVHTIDVFKDAQDARQTSLLFNMAKVGGGKYYQASSESDILNAIRQILIEIQSVNSVFASASLPINATNRSQNENQVFIGMFRPDQTGLPRWYGNLKRYQIALFGQEAKLADKDGLEAVSSETGFIQPCAASFWTSDSGVYWDFLPDSAGLCTTAATSVFSDLPDGPNVEKGAVAEVIRKGNNPPATDLTPTFALNRSIYTCANDGATVTCNTGATPMHAFNTTNVGPFALGVLAAADHTTLVNFARGVDIEDDNTNTVFTDVRPSVHGDVAHSRPLPVNYSSGPGVVVYYGANDGSFRSVRGSDGKELWAFIAPEHHSRFFRLWQQEPLVFYPTMQAPFPIPTPTRKDYFFDGSAGLFQNADDSKVWIYPVMRRGGRMIYAFDVTDPAAPRMKWRIGCTNPSMLDTLSCTTGYGQMGQTWSTPAVALVKGYHESNPLIVVGGGYDTCEDQDAAPNTQCTAAGYTRRGNRVFIIDADTGGLIRSLTTNGSVAGDVTLVDRDFDGFADHAYVATTTGSIHRVDFVDPANPGATRASTDWTITEVARTSGENRKFLFPPAALPSAGKVYLSIASGDRERPLRENYPFPTGTNPGVLNRGYMVIDKFTGGLIDLDGGALEDMSAGSSCPTLTDNPEARGSDGWFVNLNASATTPTENVGEQGVTASVIFGGLVFFSTNRPHEVTEVCSNNLGEARGYALNLLNGSGAADTANICGGSRSQVFLGGGLPPSPVTGTVPIGGKPVTVMIGGVQRTGATSSPIGAQRVTPTITQRRTRQYWYTEGDK
ncbi:MAG TPA: PilC/PilY family type IV pilus protein [Burkholderiales bacterium]|nr:PilC/PilY family type IV pilus protein [Burkholderiales bacterium]